MTVVLTLACAVSAVALAPPGRAAVSGGDERVFKLREVSAFDQPGESPFLRGQMTACQGKSFPEVKAYPVFRSDKPIYGSVRFGASSDDPDSGPLFYFALDENRGTGKGYDRLYFDVNQDLDLRNDPVVTPQRRPPTAARQTYSSINQQAVFDAVAIPFDFGPGGTRPVELMPRLTISISGTNEYQQMSFVRTRLWEGDIKVGGKEFKARLGNDYLISGRLDAPGSALVLTPKGGGGEQPSSWWGGDRLMAMHKIGGDFFVLAASPTGDELRVQPYRGDLGTFEVGAGGRAVSNLTVSGSLEGRGRAVAVGTVSEDGWTKPVSRCQLPVGAYRPSYLTVGFGRLQINVSFNYHSEGKPRDRSGRPPVYGVAIRKDQPYALDFSNKPDTLFALPPKGQRVKIGDALEVKAVLVDPQLDLMIRGLDDTTRKQTKDAEGRALGYPRNLSLDPTVTITRASGEKVAEGIMPFG